MKRHTLPSSLFFCLCISLLLSACASPGTPRVRSNPLAASRNASETIPTRLNAIKQAWQQVQEGQADRRVFRSAMKELAWALDTPEAVRAKALEAILWDDDDEADSIKLIQQMLPTEPGRMPVAVMATAAAEHHWTQCIPALVRSLARPIEAMPITDRSEYKALQQVQPDRSVEQVVLAVFLDPQTDPGPAGLHLDMRTREAAWNLLGQLHPSTRDRAALLETTLPADDQGRTILQQLRLLYHDLHVLPRTGEELRWALNLIEEKDTYLATWWQQTHQATTDIITREPDMELTMASLEPIRFASIHHADWLTQSRDQLVAQLDARLDIRQHYARMKSIRGTPTALAERFSLVRDTITWPQTLELLVLDDALHEPAVIADLFAAARKDHNDHTTEHGGVLYWNESQNRWAVRIFPPRGSSRGDDRQFIAPRDMIESTPTALAHFHFHVATWRNRDYAGPSPGDMDYAARFGRLCVVFTSLSDHAFDVDAYDPLGLVVDLGQLATTDTP